MTMLIPIDSETLAQTILSHLETQKIGIRELAQKTGIGESTLYKMVLQSRNRIRRSTFQALKQEIPNLTAIE